MFHLKICIFFNQVCHHHCSSNFMSRHRSPFSHRRGAPCLLTYFLHLIFLHFCISYSCIFASHILLFDDDIVLSTISYCQSAVCQKEGLGENRVGLVALAVFYVPVTPLSILAFIFNPFNSCLYHGMEICWWNLSAVVTYLPLLADSCFSDNSDNTLLQLVHLCGKALLPTYITLSCPRKSRRCTTTSGLQLWWIFK